MPNAFVDAQEWLSRWLLFPVHALTVDPFLAAHLIHARYQASHWDSHILAAARETDSAIVCSEGFSHGQDDARMKVGNPFP